jgi:FMN phosphatase YigB (HAD superfamily)
MKKNSQEFRKEEKQMKTWRGVAVTAICLLLAVSILYALGVGWKQAGEPAEEPVVVPGDEYLTLWTPESVARAELVSYVEAVTEEGSADYIPVENRIAVFDLDGTLFCETDPNYFDYTLLVYRVLEDPDYKDKASDYERETALKIVEQNRSGASFEGLEVDHGRCIASSFAGMTVEEFNAYIQEFKKLPMPSYEGMLRGEGWYKPMLEVVNYLQANDFTVYIVSGTDRFIVRGIVDNSPLNIPPRQIIGSDETLVAPDQGDTDGLQYVYDENDQLVLGGEFLIKNLKMNKVTVIQQEIGVQPVLSFGNSTGDASMAEYVTSNNPYRSLAFMLCCDDTVRENGSESKADKMYGLCEEYNWVPISMKNDWTTIYGEGVTRVEREPEPTEAAAAAPAEPAETRPAPISYADEANWAYYGIGEDRDVDLFLICPTVDMNDEFNMSLDDEDTKANFLGALNMERGIYEDSTRMFAPYYRQAAMKVYSLDRADWEPYMEIAYSDVSAAFAWYLEHENQGRPIILAGFSQGADMCYRLLEEYFGDEALYDQLVAVYAIGWPCTEELTAQYPQIRPAQGADDYGVVISFDCEAPELAETFISPAGQRAFGINPLNWKTDETPAEKSENPGACFTDYSGAIVSEQAALCGCYLDVQRGVVKVTDVDSADYRPIVPGLPAGAYHIYDYQFFFRSLQENVALRIESYTASHALDQAA